MELAALTLIINGIVALMGAIPSVITAIGNLDIPDVEKEALKKRIFDAQANLPVWE